MNSNIDVWKQLQDGGYFHKNHYTKMGSLIDSEGYELSTIKELTSIGKDDVAVVIGCGYGRETSQIATRVKEVYGIDVSHSVLNLAKQFLSERNVKNFIPILADDWETSIPTRIDFVFSITVFQHITRDLTSKYILGLGKRLHKEGRMLFQFADLDTSTKDVEPDKVYEPSVGWSPLEIWRLVKDSDVKIVEVRSRPVSQFGLWHWVLLGKR